ncbi:transporter substrate-binding domain-containing protein [Mesorhizobium sp. M1142]|uniref:transporter substrate-binding domain-containing protein n=1 Tax=Mesorhizobium sp. M1142 TaxID=2957060 RepID=UPI00333BBE6E
MKTGLKLIAALTASLVMTLPALSQTKQPTQQALSKESVIETIKERGVMKVGLSLFTPWAIRAKNGELIGFEIDVAKKLAADMGVDVEFYPTAWDGIIPALIAGNFDVIISGMSVTAQRNMTVNFTDNYSTTGVQLVANKKLTEGKKSLEDFNDPSVTFAGRRGATTSVAVTDNFPKAKLVLFDDERAAIQELIDGRAAAILDTPPNPARYAREYPDTIYLPFPDIDFDKRGEGFAVRKGDIDALNFFNNWIAQEWRTDWLKKRHDYWFTTDGWYDQVDSPN